MVIRYESVTPLAPSATPNCHASKLITAPARDSFIIANTADYAPHYGEESADRWRGASQSIRGLLLSVAQSDRGAPYHSTTPTLTHPHIRGHQAISFPCTSLYGLVMNFVGSHTLAPYVSRLFRWEPVWVSPYKSITCKCWLMLISAD
jgi:hypothetical protein